MVCRNLTKARRGTVQRFAMFSEKPETIAVYNALIHSLKYHGQCFTGTQSHFRVNDTGHNTLVITRLRKTGKYRNGKTMHCKTARRCTKKKHPRPLTVRFVEGPVAWR